MTEPLAYRNGQFLPQSQVHIPLNDAGFVWGATVTELYRTFRHKLFRLEDHIRRFQESCRLAHVTQGRTDNELAGIATELAARNAKLLTTDQELVLVLLATPGEIGYYVARGIANEPAAQASAALACATGSEPTLILHTFPLPFERYARHFREGARLVTPSVRHLPAACVPPQIKQRSRLFWWLAEQEVHAADPAASALLLDAEGRITETAAANFLLVRDGVVCSPHRGHILAGVSLQVVEELCGELGIEFREQDLSLDDCAAADGAMLTCTTFCVAPVSKINEQSLACPGPVFGRLLAAWSTRVEVDIRGQMLSGIM